MPLFSRDTLGIDIRDDFAVLVALRGGTRGCRLVAHEKYALDPDVDPPVRLARLGRLIGTLINERDVEEPEILISLPAHICILRDIAFPLSVKENLKETMGYEVEKYIPFSRDEVYFDCQIVGEDKREATLQVQLLAARKKDVDPYLALQAELGAFSCLETRATILGYGIGSIGGLPWKAAPGFVLFVEGERIHCNLVKGGQLLMSHACHADSGREEGDGALAETLASMRRRHTAGPIADQILVCDDEDGALSVALAAKLHLSPLPVPEILPGAGLLPAYYLALKGQRQPPSQLNLLPENLRRKPSRRSIYWSIALMATVILLSVALVGNYFLQKSMIVGKLSEETARLNREVAGLKDLQADTLLLGTRNEYLKGLGGQRTVVLDALAELSQILPDSVWIDELLYDKSQVRINGYAASATELIPILEDSPLFTGVSFLTAVRKDTGGKDIFSIGFTVVGAGIGEAEQ